MTITNTPATPRASYEDFLSYPVNLIYEDLYQETLEDYRKRLKAAAKALCGTENDLDVRFRDLDDGGILKTVSIRTNAELKARLGDVPGNNFASCTKIEEVVERKDPKCQFIFLWAAHSREHLKVTFEALTRLLSFHQVHPSYLDFLMAFGRQTEPKGFRTSGFRAQCFLHESPDIGLETSLADPEKRAQMLENVQVNTIISQKREIGRCFQLSWNLKTVVNKLGPVEWPNPDGFKHWSIRQAAFYHRFDIESGKLFWICTSGREVIQERIEDLTGSKARRGNVGLSTPEASFRFSLKVLLDFCQWSTEGWRDYLCWSEESMEGKTELAVLGTRDEVTYRTNYTSTDLQNIQIWEDIAQDATTVLEANIEVVRLLRDFYIARRDDNSFLLGKSCGKDVTAFAAQVTNLVADMMFQVGRAKAMIARASSRKSLVVQHLQSQAAEEMGYLAKESQREAIAMRVIAVVTTLFLPATFVSTFFSTDIVKYQSTLESGDKYTSFSTTAMMRWLQVSLPLTFFTLLGAGIWYLRASRRLGAWDSATRWIRRPNYER